MNERKDVNATRKTYSEYFRAVASQKFLGGRGGVGREQSKRLLELGYRGRSEPPVGLWGKAPEPELLFAFQSLSFAISVAFYALFYTKKL